MAGHGSTPKRPARYPVLGNWVYSTAWAAAGAAGAAALRSTYTSPCLLQRRASRPIPPLIELTRRTEMTLFADKSADLCCASGPSLSDARLQVSEPRIQGGQGIELTDGICERVPGQLTRCAISSADQGSGY